MKGKRSAGNRTAGRTAVRRKKETLSSRERRQLTQLVLCGGIFVLLVVSKLVLPVRMEPVNQKISEAMGRNMDVQAVFSAVAFYLYQKENIVRFVLERFTGSFTVF